MRCTFTNRTIGMTSFSIGTNAAIQGTNGPSVWRIDSFCVYWTLAFGQTEPTTTILMLLVLRHQIITFAQLYQKQYSWYQVYILFDINFMYIVFYESPY